MLSTGDVGIGVKKHLRLDVTFVVKLLRLESCFSPENLVAQSETLIKLKYGAQ